VGLIAASDYALAVSDAAIRLSRASPRHWAVRGGSGYREEDRPRRLQRPRSGGRLAAARRGPSGTGSTRRSSRLSRRSTCGCGTSRSSSRAIIPKRCGGSGDVLGRHRALAPAACRPGGHQRQPGALEFTRKAIGA
jgi:hypothetical protein